MANFFAVVDPDPERRRRSVDHARRMIAPVDGLRKGDGGVGDFHVVWAAAPDAPVSVSDGEDGCAVLWGEAIEPDTSRRVTAGHVRAGWNRPSADAPCWDGFHAAVSYGPSKGLVAGCDLLGLYPLYYAWARPVLMVASTPEMVRWHPRLGEELDHRGLAGVLLTGASFRGRTLWTDVTRLSPGCLLAGTVWQPPREIENFRPSPATSCARLSFPEQLEALDDALDTAVSRHVASDRHAAILLSGGRDSRLLAGTARRSGFGLTALTFGRPSDHEMRCAEALVRRLGFPHRRAEYPAPEYPRWAGLHTRWEQLACSFGAMYTWGALPYLRRTASRVLSGHLLELVLGGIQEDWGEREEARDDASDAFFAAMNRHAVPLETLRWIVRSRELGEAVEEVAEEIRWTFRSYGGPPSRRAQRFLFEHWGRHHPGSAPWRFSFGAWPVLPVLDRQLLELGLGLPLSTVAGRRAEDALLRTRHPSLARAPLDRNSPDVRPLIPGPGWMLRDLLRRASRLFPSTLRPTSRGGAVERRFYHRIYDFDGPGWRKVRQLAEPHREDLRELFHDRRLASYVPPPGEVEVDLDDPIIDSFGRKTLVGWMLVEGRRNP